jgi:quinol monooxygenase YgiN
MATILAHIQTKPGQEATFEAVIRDLYAATGEEAGKRHYQYWRAATPGLYYCLLAFDDFNSFITHQTSDHHEAASPKLGDCIADLKLEWVDPVGGASDLPPTETQSLPADANELRQQYHELFAIDAQDWWQSLR